MEINNINKETEFVTYLLSKDKKQFAILYTCFYKALHGIIFKIVQNHELSEDILQDVFLKIWNNAHTYDEKKSRLFTWMLNIARNTAIDYMRSKQGRMAIKNQPIDSYLNINEKPNNHSPNHDYIGLKKMVDDLKPDQQQIIDLAFFEGYTHPQIAEKLQIPLGTVKTKCRAAINCLRKSLGSDTSINFF